MSWRESILSLVYTAGILCRLILGYLEQTKGVQWSNRTEQGCGWNINAAVGLSQILLLPLGGCLNRMGTWGSLSVYGTSLPRIKGAFQQCSNSTTVISRIVKKNIFWHRSMLLQKWNSPPASFFQSYCCTTFRGAGARDSPSIQLYFSPPGIFSSFSLVGLPVQRKD